MVVTTHNGKAGENAALVIKKPGCAGIGLLVIGAVGILFMSSLAQLLLWIIEQGLIEGSLPVPDLRWLVTLGYGLSIFLPTLVVTLALKPGRVRSIYQSWMQAALLSLVLFPVRLLPVTAAQETGAAQLAGVWLTLLGLQMWRRRNAGERTSSSSSPGLALALLGAAVLAVPWLIIGAQGSALDSLLGLAVGLSFGILAASILSGGIFSIQDRARSALTAWGFTVDGLTAMLALFILVTGLGQNGSQWLLALAVPGLGWACAALAAWARTQGNATSRPAIAALVGFTAAMPLIWFDADELALIITSGSQGELIGWALRAGAITLGLGLLIGSVFYFSVRSSPAPGKNYVLRILAALGWLTAAGLYFWLGQPGFYGERLFVILNDQLDVSHAARLDDAILRRQTVYQALTEHAMNTQVDLRTALDRWRIPYQPYYLINALEVQSGPLVRWWLESRVEVDRVLDSPVLRPLPAELLTSNGIADAPDGISWNLAMIGADKVWQLGITGEGILIGQSDSGVQGSHPELAASYRGWQGEHDYNWFDPWYGSSQPVDIGGHGTHTLGIILGEQVGVAPGAEWIGCVNLARNLGNPALYLDCMQFLLAPFPQKGDPLRDGDPARGAHVLNNSWGCPEIEGCDADTFLSAVDALQYAGVFVVGSAGNAGYSGCSSVKDPPAIYAGVYSVGAIDRFGELADFSSIGPVVVDGSQRVKPDIVAPGVEVLSAFPNDSYQAASGTSMAGPHVAGTVALIWSANPALIGDIERTRQILNQSAAVYLGVVPECALSPTIPNNATGYGVLDAYAAVRAALDMKEASD